MLIPIARLLARRREVAAIARGLAGRPTPHEAALAARVRELKLQLAAATGPVTACSSCARGKPGERGGYAGGDCCSGQTALVFSADEATALAHAGTRARDLRPASGEQAGCAFRGARGCSLPVAHRPAICVRYACNTLQRELHAGGRLDEVEALAIALGAALADHTAAVADRRADDFAAAMADSLIRAT